MILARLTPVARSKAMNAIPISVMVFRSTAVIDSPVSFIVTICCDDYHCAHCEKTVTFGFGINEEIRPLGTS